MSVRRLFAACALAAFAWCAAARADTPPSRWDMARDPGLADRWALHVKVRELLVMSGDREDRAMEGVALDRARGLLEEADAAHSPDVRLRFDLGEVYEAMHLHERAIAVLQPAVDAAPDHPASVGALVALAYAYAYLDRSKEEREAYHRYLSRVYDDRLKATALLNLAEAEMHLGQLDDAVASYRDALALTTNMPNSYSGTETTKLVVWGLAVALDRAGDPQGSFEQARLATQMDPGEQLIGHGPNVFFVPEYERDWYLALAENVHAKTASTPREALEAWTRCEAHWNTYVTGATANDPGDRYLPLARSHLARAHAQRAQAEKRLRESPPPPPPILPPDFERP